MPRLENWSVGGLPRNEYEAPELWATVLYGFIYDDEKERFPDGRHVHTSTLKELDINNMLARTRNTVYKLGQPDPRFLEYLKTNGYKLEDYHKVTNEKPIIDISDIKIEKNEIFKIDFFDFEKLVKRVYNVKEYEFVADIECGNDSSHSFNVEPHLDEWSKKKINEFIEKGTGLFLAGHLLNDMCEKGIIEKGEYLIDVCW